jgi:hypothetical protein
MSVQVWSNVGVSVQSAAATAITITAISKANPAVVTYTGTDPSNGDYVLLSVQGMSQMDRRIVRVASVDAGANTFACESVNSTAYDTFTSGTGQVLTFGTTLNVVSNISASGGDFQFIDVTTIHDDIQKQIPGNASPTTFSMDCQWQPDDAGLLAMKAASDSKSELGVMLSFANGYRYLVTGYIGCTLSPTGSAQQVVSTPVVITAYGRPQTYAT